MLEALVNAHGISGNESRVREVIRKQLKGCADKIWIDNIGNLIAHKEGSKPTVMLAAHMDEVGLMVRYIDDEGRVYFSALGGIEVTSLIGQRVSIGDMIGVITTEGISKGNGVEELPKMEELYVDTGLAKKELERKGVGTGSYISFMQCDFCSMGSKKIIAGKALDDRIGCHVLVELAKRLKKSKNDVYYVFTVQEEIGLYGAKVSAYKIQPDWAIVVDVTDEDFKTRKVGKGPCITVKDSEMLGNRCINGWLENIAKKQKIPLQLEVSDAGTTDALSISLSREGTPTSVVGVAVRNMHTATSIASMEDINNTIRLLELLLKKPPKVCLV